MNIEVILHAKTLLRLAVVTAMTGVLATPAPQPNQTANAVLREIRAHHKGIAIWWVGNAGWLIKSDDLLIGIDLDLSTEEKAGPPPVTAEELAGELDAEMVTHHHGDHCNVPTIRALAQGGRCTFVLPRPCLKEVADLRIASGRIVVPEPLQPFDL